MQQRQGNWARLIFLVLAMSWASGCKGISPPASGDSVRETVIIPFVEEVSVPESMRASEVATVTIRFSAALLPGLFTTSGFAWGSGSELDAIGGDLGVLYDDRSFFLSPSRAGAAPPGNLASFNIIATHPGTYTLRIGTTKSRETGGTSVETVVTPGFIFPSGRDPFTYTAEYVIEVFPAP